MNDEALKLLVYDLKSRVIKMERKVLDLTKRTQRAEDKLKLPPMPKPEPEQIPLNFLNGGKKQTLRSKFKRSKQ